MKLVSADSLYLLATLLAPVASAQTPPTPPEIPSVETRPRDPVGSDGKPLVAGKLPDDTTTEARAAWQKTLAASIQTVAERPPIQAFSFDIDAEFKQNPQQVNQVDGTFEFLTSQGYMRVRLKSGLEHLRGPDGDFFVDPNREGAMKLSRNVAEDKDDIRQIDDAVAVARNFLALANPSTLRVAKLAQLAAPPVGVPRAFEARAKELGWLEVHSPDFRLSRSIGAAGERGLYRVQLGVDAKTSLPVFALIHAPAQGGAANARPGAGTLFLELREWFVENGYRLPKQIDTYEFDAPAPANGAPAGDVAAVVRREPTTSVVLKRARINPPLTADSFRPPKKN